MRVLGFSFAGSCAAAGCKPAVQPEEERLAKRLEAASTLPKDARLVPFAKFLLQTTKLHAESVAHTSQGLRPWRNPWEAPPKQHAEGVSHSRHEGWVVVQ